MRRNKKVLRNVLAVAVLAGVFIAGRSLGPILAMRPTATGPVADSDVQAVKVGNNSVYFLPLDEGWLAVDTGTNPTKLRDGMRSLGIEPEEVRHILLTHADSDHVAGLPLFPQAQLHLSRKTYDTVFVAPASGREKLAGSAPADVAQLVDGAEITLGGREVRCVALPGHTPGSMGYLVDGEYFFSGDAVRMGKNGMRVHPFTMDESTVDKNIETIGALGAGRLFTAHYGVWDIGPK